MRSLLPAAEPKTSKSPSRSMSTIRTHIASSILPSIFTADQSSLSGDPSLTYHLILPVVPPEPFPAATTSMSPSSSISAARTYHASSKEESIVCSVQPPSEGVPSFSHQVTSSLFAEPVLITSMSTSLSKSKPKTELAPE